MQTGMVRSTAQVWGVVLAVLFQICATFLPALGFGVNIGEQSDATNTLITPAGWAFIIWGPLYSGSIVYAVYQALPRQRSNGLLASTAWPAACAFFGNGLWALYVQFTDLNGISVAIILFTLASILVAFRQFAPWQTAFSRAEQWCVVLPLSTLAAWLSAASIVNVAASLKYHGIDAGSMAPTLSAAVVVVGGIIAATAVLRERGNPWYALVFLWALAAIHAAGGQVSEYVGMATLIAAALVSAAALYALANAGNRRHWFKAG